MNCKKVVQLIPLFIEADLETSDMQSVTGHLETCKSCSNTVKEFQASQSMLRSVALPEFDEAIFAQLRSSVLNEIARPKFTDAIHPIWNWKAAFAAPLAMIILMCGIAMVRLNTNENHVAQADIFKDTKAENFAFSSSRDIKNVTANPYKSYRIPKPRSGRNPIAQGEASTSKRNPGNINTNRPSPERAIEIDREEKTAGINNSIPVIPEATAILNAEKPIPEPEMLRIEIQTADPNIKIIWLVPKDSNLLQTAADAK